jgi:hypothetical protein
VGGLHFPSTHVAPLGLPAIRSVRWLALHHRKRRASDREGGWLKVVSVNYVGYRRGEGGDKSNIRIKGCVYIAQSCS